MQADRRVVVAGNGHVSLASKERAIEAAGVTDLELIAWTAYLTGGQVETGADGKARFNRVRGLRGVARFLAHHPEGRRAPWGWTKDRVRALVGSARIKVAAWLVEHGRAAA